MEEEILKTLESIEKLLKSSSVLGGKSLPSAVRGQQTASQKAGKDAAKSFRAVSQANKDTTSTVLGLNKSLVGLNSEVGKTTVSFGSLNSQMAKFMATLQTDVNTDKQVPSSIPVVSTVNIERPLLTILSVNRELLTVTSSIRDIVANQKSSDAPQSFLSKFLTSKKKTTATTNQPSQPKTPTTEKPVTPNLGPLNKSALRTAGVFGKTAGAGILLGAAFDKLGEFAQQATSDYFKLARIGMGSTETLFGLYKSAIKAGMSLEQYTQMVRENTALASRSGSMANFDKIISAYDDQLAAMGIFGAEARDLQASMNNSAIMMGIKFNDLGKAVGGQVSLFDQLRKSTNMTANEFGKLMTEMADNTQVQKELVGLSPQQRIARQQEIANTMTIGQKMGLASEASKRLADAMIAARGATVKDRFEQAGRIRQLGALVGQGAKAERVAQLNMKGRRRTSAEDNEMRQLLGEIDKSAQGLYDVGSYGMQNALDEMQKSIGEGDLGKITDANRAAQLASESGKVFNAEFGQHVGAFGQAVGKLLALGKGLMESPLMTLGAGISLAILAAFKGPIFKVLSGIGSAGGAGATAATGAAGGVLSKTLSGLGSVMNFLLKPITAMRSGISSLADVVLNVGTVIRKGWNAAVFSIGITNPLTFLKNAGLEFMSSLGKGTTQAASALKNAGTAVWGGIKAFTKAFAPAAMLIDGIIEVFTGTIATALNPSGGFFDRVGGVITAALSAIPNFLIDAFSFVFGENLGKQIQNKFDIFVTVLNIAVRGFIGAIVDGVKWITKFLPDDSKLHKMITGWADGIAQSQSENTETLRALQKDPSLTLEDLAKQREDQAVKAKESAKTAEAAATKAEAAQAKYNNVQYGKHIDPKQVVADAKTLVATPQVEKPKAVTPPAPINKEEKQKASTDDKQTENKALATPDIAAILQSMLQVLTRSMNAEELQAQLTAQILDQTGGRKPFTSSEEIARRLMNTKRG